MKEKIAYSYVVLRYSHDVLAGECINVGIVLLAPKERQLLFRLNNKIGRLRRVFPDIDRSAFQDAISAANKGLQLAMGRIKDSDLFWAPAVVTEVAFQALPSDDSSLQWSKVGSGLTSELNQTLEQLYERFVSRYETPGHARRSDDDIWRPVRQLLDDRKLSHYLTEKSIKGAVDDIQFKHAWKNGVWNVYEPISFDLADANGIKTKAREWHGHLSSVVAGGDAEPFKPHFIVGAPTNLKLQDAYETALAILQSAPNGPLLFPEDQAESLVAQMEDEIREHIKN